MRALFLLWLLTTAVYAQVQLKIVATDRSGNPVRDLQSTDVRVNDDGANSPITSFHLRTGQPVSTVTILFDLINLTIQQRALATIQLRQPLPVPARLYLLLEDGRLYPVAGVGKELDKALEKTSRNRPMDIRTDPIESFKTTYSALDSMSQELSRYAGSKQLLWITYGIPDGLRGVGSWRDFTPRLRELAARFNRNDIAIYSMDPGFVLGTENRNGLSILSSATGGRSFGSTDIQTVLKQMERDASATYLLEFAPSSRKTGDLHMVHFSANRKGVRIFGQEAYLPAEPAHLVAVAAPVTRMSVIHELPAEPTYTFVGTVQSFQDRSLVLATDDLRFIVFDFDRNAKVNLEAGDRVSIRSDRYDGRGLMAKSWSLLEPGLHEPSTLPVPSGGEPGADPFLDQAREAAAQLVGELPDFLCKEVVTRLQYGSQDVLSAVLAYSRKPGEDYREIRVNGHPTNKSWVELGGDVSTGEFGSLLRSLLRNPDSDFEFVKDELITGRPAALYSFRISREESDWKVLSDFQYIVPAYSGSIWFDRETKQVVRMMRKAEEIPATFPLRSVEGSVDYRMLQIGPNDRYLLPQHAKTMVCIRGHDDCSRKDIQFSDYHKFTVESKVVPQ